MKTSRLFYFYCLIVLLAVGCGDIGQWTEEERKKFETECLQSDSIYNKSVSFYGFENNEFDSVLIMEFKDSVLVDSFKLFAFPSQGPDQRKRKERHSHPIKAMSIHNKYRFIVPGQMFELTNMKKKKHPQYTEESEGWGCVLGSYTVDGIRVDEDQTVRFVKHE